ncbi:putative hydrolase YxeP [Spirochaetia bacterium]|nr:putative hydrolase YxeP [Spirochaetia bacterium]
MNTDDLQSQLESYFKWFHRHPELSNDEHETTARIREILTGAGIEILNIPLKTGLVARIRGARGSSAPAESEAESQSSPPDGPVVALRSDIDALPVTEISCLDYASEQSGVMHACGHDFHITALLGTALLLQAEKENLGGTIKLIFQPAEEGGGGAQQVLDTGVLDDTAEIYGLHTAAENNAGVIAVSPGPSHAAVGAFRILLRGVGGHAAYPHLCKDPIVAGAQIINAAQTIISRNTSPFDQAVLSFTHTEAGSNWNVIPPEALLEGTTRAFSVEKLTGLNEQLKQIAVHTGEVNGIAVEYEWHINTISTNNDPALTAFVSETAKAMGYRVQPRLPGMGGEDFALYQQRIPGVFWTIGVGSPQALHHPGFIADTAALSAASRLMAALGREALQRLNHGPH